MEKKAKDAGEKSSMTDDKAKLLEDIGFVWAKRKGQNAWEQKFLELQLYSQKHGHCKSDKYTIVFFFSTRFCLFILIVSTTLVKICLPLTLVASSFYLFIVAPR